MKKKNINNKRINNLYPSGTQDCRGLLRYLCAAADAAEEGSVLRGTQGLLALGFL